jgi:hypothetical protein
MADNQWANYLKGAFPKHWSGTTGYMESNPSEIQYDMWDQNPAALWQYATSPAEGRPNRGFRSYLGNNMAKYQNQYYNDMNLGNIDSGMTFYDWLNSSNFNPYSDYSKLSPTERGERPGVFGGRGRWVL